MSLVCSDLGSDVNVLGQRLGEGGGSGLNPSIFQVEGALLVGGTTDRLITSTLDVIVYVQPKL